MRQCTGYRGFISYARLDRRVATRLHRALEAYRVPRGIDVPVAPARRLGRFFMDRDELPAGVNLGAAIRGALDDASTLIVVASPTAARSEWVAAEIDHFRAVGSRPILALIARGAPNARDPTQECFPPKLRGGAIGDEPLAADLTQEPFRRALIRLVAGVLDTSFDTLWNRERRRRRRRHALVGTALAMLAFAGIAAVALQQTRLDVQTLVASSAMRAQDGWQNAWRPDYFGPALRAAIAAVQLSWDAPGPITCDLSRPVDRPICALALSGHAVPSRLLYGAMPAQEQDNIRIDIEGAWIWQRRMITAEQHARAVALAEDPVRIAIVTNEPRLIILDVDGAVLLDRPLAFVSEAVAISADGRHVLVGNGTSSLLLIDMEEGSAKSHEFPHDRLNHAESLNDGWLVLVDGQELARLDSALRVVWREPTVETDVYNMAPLAARRDRFTVLESSGVHALVETFAVATGERSLVENPVIGQGVGQVKALAVSADGKRLVLGGNGSGGGDRAGAQVIDIETGAEIARLVGGGAEIYATRFLPGTSLVATGASDFSIRIWDADTGAERIRLIGHGAPIQDLEIDRNGRLMASASWDGTVRLWQLPGNWTAGAREFVKGVCDAGEGAIVGQTLLEAERRSGASAGRPANVCAWRGLETRAGWSQALSNLGARL